MRDAGLLALASLFYFFRRRKES
ncbi:MAG: LPXTG cell wall anchor domain-containing protein [Clostridiales bacterium]|nr:LPXTG cell wall anchor domain-containing protein [Clostridiales bacterium]